MGEGTNGLWEGKMAAKGKLILWYVSGYSEKLHVFLLPC